MSRTIYDSVLLFGPTLELKSLWYRLPLDKSTKLQYNLLAFIASLLRVTDEDSLSDMTHALVFSLLSKELTLYFY